MNGIFVPFLPAALWLLGAVFLALLLLLLFGAWLYLRAHMRKLGSSDLGELLVQTENLKQEIQRLTQQEESQKNELLKLEAERKSQEEVRLNLAELEKKASAGIERQKEVQALVLHQEALLEELRAQSSRYEYLDQKTTARKAELEALDASLAATRIQAASLQEQALRVEELKLKESVMANRFKALEDAIKNHEMTVAPLRLEVAENRHLAEEAEKQRAAAESRLETLLLLEKEKAASNQVLETRRIALEESLENLLASKENLEKGLTGQPEASAFSDLLIPPASLRRDIFTDKMEGPRERRMLQAFQASLKTQGYIFPERIIGAFHTSLKCQFINPLTVLAGISGTGKTLLPIKYAEFMGLHHLVISVQPRWDSPQDLFGFYNYLEKRYKATELSRILLRMDPKARKERGIAENWQDQRLILTVLDEMNLAKPEYYFSDFLSRLELRRLYARGASQAQVEIDLGGATQLIAIPPNILFVGTMNEDESAQTLSDKILDRANVLRFGKPASQWPGGRQENPATIAQGWLSFADWQKWLKQNEAINVAPKQDAARKWLDQACEALSEAGRPIGFRAQEAILTYCANYPGVESDDRHKLAFADQVEQKILPRLRGVELNEQSSRNAFARLSDLLDDLGDRTLLSAFDMSIRNATGIFYWHGASR